MEEHEGLLYLGTMDSTIWVRFLNTKSYPEQIRDIVEEVGAENIVANDAGCDLWRSDWAG